MSRIDQALKRADLAAGVQQTPVRLRDDRAASLESVLEEYPLEPPAPSPEVSLDLNPARLSSLGASRTPLSSSTDGAREAIRLPNKWRMTEGKLVVSQDTSPVWVEQYRRLAASLYQAQTETRLKTIMVSSTLPREGKTLTVANLALTLSESYAQRVLVIDADLRNPSMHDIFELSNAVGLSDYLAAKADQPPILAVSATLSVMPGGSDVGNPIAGLVSDRMKQLMEWAASQFDWVLLDTPPVGLLPDANLLARLTDAVVFVVAASSAPYALVQRALSAIGPERVIGVVLNRASESMLPSGAHYTNYVGTTPQSAAAPEHHG